MISWYLKIIVIVLLSVTCKKQVSDPTKATDNLLNDQLSLKFSRQGLLVKIGDHVPPQKFYRLRLERLDFSAEQIAGEITSSEVLTFEEVIFAFRDGGLTFTCQLKDVSQQLTVIDIEKHCYVQPEQEDYFRQFVEWCEKGADSKRSPWTGNWQSNIGCKRLSHNPIPAFCFMGNANACFPNLSDEIRSGGSQLTNYIQKTKVNKTREQMFIDILETIDSEIFACHPHVISDDRDKELYCKCGSSGSITLNGKIRQCSRDQKSNALVGFKYHYHLFNSYYLSPTGPYKPD